MGRMSTHRRIVGGGASDTNNQGDPGSILDDRKTPGQSGPFEGVKRSDETMKWDRADYPEMRED